MSQVIITVDDVIKRYEHALKAIGQKKTNRAFANALNRGGRQARTFIRRSLVAQTGIKYGLINKAVVDIPAHANRLEYSLVATGDETNLNLFNARQGKKGVSASPWKKRRVFKSTFLVAGYGGKVYHRTSKERGPIAPLFGPNISREIMKKPTLPKWDLAAGFVMLRVEHELMRLFS